jgi:hypothetical protein
VRSAVALILIGVSLAAIMGMVALNFNQVYAPRQCAGCGEFKKLTHEFEKNVINAIGNPEITPGPRELLSAYVDDVNNIFLGGPDTIPGLLEQYQQAVLAVFVEPPDPDKQEKHDQIKEFRQLTHTFEKAVIGAVNPPELE